MSKADLVSISSLIICVCALWGIVSNHYRDGIIGKCILFVMSISAFGTFTKAYSDAPINDISETTLLCTLAVYWIRHLWVVNLWHPIVRRYYIKNPHRDRRKNPR